MVDLPSERFVGFLRRAPEQVAVPQVAWVQPGRLGTSWEWTPPPDQCAFHFVS